MPAPEHFHVVLWEVAMEAARMATDPGLPSRLDCVFVTETIEGATQFRDRFRVGAAIYEVEPIGELPRLHRGDFALISDHQYQDAYADYMARACLEYWTVAPADFPEVLYPEPLNVTRRI